MTETICDLVVIAICLAVLYGETAKHVVYFAAISTFIIAYFGRKKK